VDCLEDMRNSLADGNPLLERALDLERRYDWQGAAEAYDNVLRSASEDDSPTLGDIIERKAYALHRWNTQLTNTKLRGRHTLSHLIASLHI
jgi:hypothetical protein